MEIRRLSSYPEYAASLAQLHSEEWSHLYEKWDTTAALKEFLSEDSKSKIPVTFLAMENEELLGSVSIVLDDLPVRPVLNPWLASMYVLPGHRGKGIGRALLFHAVQYTCENELMPLYLYTEDKAGFFEKMGFERWEEIFSNGHPVTVMRCG